MLLKYHFLEVHDIILVLKSFIGDFFFIFGILSGAANFVINFRTKGFQSHHKEDCVFNAHAHVAVELSVLAIKVRMINFWCKISMGKQSKISHICYELLYNNNYIRDGL